MSDEYWTPAPRPCSCIAPGEPMTLHLGHCCIREMPDNDEWPPCHRTEWEEMYGEQLEDPVK